MNNSDTHNDIIQSASSFADGNKSEKTRYINQNTHNQNKHSELPERLFMTSLLKHTGIALALLIPLAAYSTFAKAATPDISETVSKSIAPSFSVASVSFNSLNEVSKLSPVGTII